MKAMIEFIGFSQAEVDKILGLLRKCLIGSSIKEEEIEIVVRNHSCAFNLASRLKKSIIMIHYCGLSDQIEIINHLNQIKRETNLAFTIMSNHATVR